MTGLMFHRPDDHLTYLIECIQKVQLSGSNTVNWNAFVEFKNTGTALPPISAASQRDSADDVSSGRHMIGQLRAIFLLQEMGCLL